MSEVDILTNTYMYMPISCMISCLDCASASQCTSLLHTHTDMHTHTHTHRSQHSDNNYIPSSYLPSFLDLVIWGHEHECHTEPEYEQTLMMIYKNI